MPLAIQIENEFLDLPPDTTLELESDNPFLQFNDELRGNYSLPFEVLASPKNMRLLNYAGILQQKITNEGIEANVYDNGIQHSRGKIKLETSQLNVNRPGSGTISCYYLTGSSDFFQDSKNKRLREIDVGGVRTFSGASGALQTSEFGLHVLDAMTSAPGSYDYAFYPVYNNDWGSDPIPADHVSLEIMNKIQMDGGGQPALFPGSFIPFPYLKYVLTKAIEFTGWKLQGDILTDEDFQRITMINFRSIDWSYLRKAGPFYLYTIHPSISFNLQDHLPDISVNEFLIALKNRFGWWYDFDRGTRTVTIRHLKDLVSLSVKDVTSVSSPLLTKKVRQENRVFALKNNFIAGGGDGIDLNLVNYQGHVNKVSNLPAAAEARAWHVYLVVEENNYYVCAQNLTTDAWEWEIHSANIYNYEPAGFNEEVITSATAVEMVKYDNYMDMVPRVDTPGIWTGVDGEIPWGIHLSFFYGLRNNKASQPVPFASHHIYDSNGNQVGNWSLAFKGKRTDGTEVGLYDLEWKTFFDLLNGKEDFQCTLYLPFDQYLKLKFSDTIVISNTKMFISRVNSAIPYRKQIKVEAIRIL